MRSGAHLPLSSAFPRLCSISYSCPYSLHLFSCASFVCSCRVVSRYDLFIDCSVRTTFRCSLRDCVTSFPRDAVLRIPLSPVLLLQHWCCAYAAQFHSTLLCCMHCQSICRGLLFFFADPTISRRLYVCLYSGFIPHLTFSYFSPCFPSQFACSTRFPLIATAVSLSVFLSRALFSRFSRFLRLSLFAVLFLVLFLWPPVVLCCAVRRFSFDLYSQSAFQSFSEHASSCWK